MALNNRILVISTALGSARDDIDTLKKMIKYLEGEL